MYDVIIIGAGPAGISASLYTRRANLKTLILYQKEGALEKTKRIENYYGFENGISGQQLYEIGIRQAQNIGVEVKKEEVLTIQLEKENEFEVKTQKNSYLARSIILATGNKKNKPNIKNIEAYEGRGVSYCAVCDGFFYRNKPIAVIGNGNYAISEVNELINLASNIQILTNGEDVPEFRIEDEKIKIDTRQIQTIKGEKKVEEIVFQDGTTLKTEGIFVAIRSSTEVLTLQEN